jgi:transposase-like protein
MAMYLISSHKKGISSHQLYRDLDVTQKTAWFILHKVRTLFAQYDTPALEGEIELDEMYLGGRETNKHQSKKTEGTQGRSTKTKTPIFGMVQRDGLVHALKVTDTKASTLLPIIKQFCKENAHFFTDELTSYACLNGAGMKHSVIEHGKKEFSKDGITTNSIEGFWGHFKRMVFGTYHFVSKDYLQRYLDEAVYRYNTRKADESTRFADIFCKSIGIVSYMDVKVVKQYVAA